ncbi:MAG: ATP-grasp domain-containing protein [Verrucomicrobiota bacterium]
MRLIYPADTFRPKVVDETYEEEYEAAKEAGFSVSLFNFEEFQAGSFKVFPPIEAGEVTLYRGWMMTGPEYTRFHQALTTRGASPLTTPEEYLKCHHLPGWYDLLKPFTAETRFYTEADDIAADLASVGWTGCFMKDYVKSLSTDGGSVVSDLSALESVIQKMRKYRGQIEGGLCARHLEDYDASTERRFFVFRGRAFGDGTEVPLPVMEAASQISSPFFTVDVAMRCDGVLRIIELGDGQVSDRKHWGSHDFVRVLGDVKSALK